MSLTVHRVSITSCHMLQQAIRAAAPAPLGSLLQRLPAAHPAMLWTRGTVHTFARTRTERSEQESREFSQPHGRHARLLHHFTCSSPLYPASFGAKSTQCMPAVLHNVASPLLKRDLHQVGDGGKKQAQKHFVLSPQGIVEASPPSLQPYMKLVRLDRPIGSWLLFLPCTFSITLASPAGCLPDPYMLGLFAVGSVLMRGAGCTINDMWDKDFDCRVARTRDRPLPSGDITNFQALSFLGLQLSGALAILLSLNWPTVFLGASCMSLVITYPLMKRYTFWPQAFLGVTLNWGVLIAWSGIKGGLGLPGLILYLSCALWTMTYDSIYSHQDKEDDRMIGVKSTALKFGDQTKYWLTGFASLMTTGLTVVGYLCDQTWPYYAGVAMVGTHLGRQIYTVDLDDPEDCGSKFRSNRNLGLAFWATIVVANLLKEGKPEKEEDQEQKESLEISPA